MATHTIGEFYGNCETWKLYMEYLVWYFATNDMESADKKPAIFSVCDPAMYQLIKNSWTSEANQTHVHPITYNQGSGTAQKPKAICRYSKIQF